MPAITARPSVTLVIVGSFMYRMMLNVLHIVTPAALTHLMTGLKENSQ